MNFWNDLARPFFALAPMEGVTDIVFRDVIAHACPPDVFFTEFTNVSSFASEKGRKNALTRLVPNRSIPTVAQIWGKKLEDYPTTAGALNELGFAGADIKMGCPDRHVIKAGGGSDFIRNPERAARAIRLTKSATDLPVSVKTRLGYTSPDEFREWLPVILAEKPAALTVHLRTKKEMSKVPAHYELIPEICELRNNISPETKLIINGDIKSREIGRSWADEVDGFMIGRGVFGNPYCFSDRQPTTDELLRLFLYHLDLFDRRKIQLEREGEEYPFEPLKHFYKVYIKDFSGANQLRQRLMSCTTTAELRDTLYQEFPELK